MDLAVQSLGLSELRKHQGFVSVGASLESKGLEEYLSRIYINAVTNALEVHFVCYTQNLLDVLFHFPSPPGVVPSCHDFGTRSSVSLSGSCCSCTCLLAALARAVSAASSSPEGLALASGECEEGFEVDDTLCAALVESGLGTSS